MRRNTGRRAEVNRAPRGRSHRRGNAARSAPGGGVRAAGRGRGGTDGWRRVHQCQDLSEAESRRSEAEINSAWLKQLGDDPEVLRVLEKLSRSEEQDRFIKLMSGDLSDEMILSIVKVLGSLCEVEYHRIVVTLLQLTCGKDFVDKLCLFIVNLDENLSIHSDLHLFFEKLCSFFNGMLKLMPTFACERLAKLIQLTSQAVETTPGFIESVEFIEKLTFIKNRLTNEIEKRSSERVKVSSDDERLQYQRPPNDFRDISITPTIEDIKMNVCPFLRPSIVKGPYQDVEHYLDVHFRLLKEDFTRPLRDGIYEYNEKKRSMESKKRKFKVNNVRIYEKVVIQQAKIEKDSFGLMVNFDPEKKIAAHVDWTHSKRFMTGSLLLLTRDNFSNIMPFTVGHRSPDRLKQGFIMVELCEGYDDYEDLFSVEFLMIESQAFFGAYAPVMQALKMFDELAFPLKEYIVEGKCDSVLPKYLTKDENPQITLKTLSGCGKWSAKDVRSWPQRHDMGLDESQYQAFVKALTSKIMLIQGPPGTGKTFLGLKVVTTLLHSENKKLWLPGVTAPFVTKRPMLVVCYTNHALDQFLVGMMSATEKIARVGGGCKVAKLERFTMNGLRQSVRLNRSYSSPLFRQRKMEFDSSHHDFEYISQGIKALDRNAGVMTLQGLVESGCVPVHTICMSQEEFLHWLLGHDIQQSRERWLFDIGALCGPDILCSNLVMGQRVSGLLLFDKVQRQLDLVSVEIIQCSNGYQEYSEMEPIDTWILEDFTRKLEHLEKKATQLKAVSAIRNRLESMKKIEISQQFEKVCSTICLSEDLWTLSLGERCQLYRWWVQLLLNDMKKKRSQSESKCLASSRLLNECRMMRDQLILQTMDVIGMTTTYASKNQEILKQIKPRIVIVEEAAEVLESHIVVALAGDVEQLILIGDHQQLRPNPAVFELARKYHMDLSLFERLLNNQVDCVALTTQHRMRPAIASLICPTIYTNLINDQSVYMYPDIQGIEKNLYFIDHTCPQEQVADIQSFQNLHEAKFLSALVEHLLFQGYKGSQITLLCTYTGQLFLLFKMRKMVTHSHLADIKIAVVDNYQGEENDIILLSLVRSNEENLVGFLSTGNRICVALSRAKHGMYIIGNMNSMTGKESVWTKIKAELEEQDALGDSLPLRCALHATSSKVKSDKDFKQLSPNGGCLQPCGVLLQCGHPCAAVCHVQGRDRHADPTYKCLVPCERTICEFNHPCPRRCFQDCEPCMVPKEGKLACGHTAVMPCHFDVAEFKCREWLMDVELPCGHTGNKYCFVDPEKVKCQALITRPLICCGHEREMKCCQTEDIKLPCIVKCPFRLPCGHSCDRTCHTMDDPNHEEYNCERPCALMNEDCKLDHKCKKKCHEPCERCPIKVEKILLCGHEANISCHLEPDAKWCAHPCEKLNACGHQCKRKCGEKCDPCMRKILKELPDCGHECQHPCGLDVKTVVCREKCSRTLRCGHPCSLICSKECSLQCSVLTEYSKDTLCGHVIQIPCYMQDYGSDNLQLLIRCREPCRTLLKCGHRCSGTCGECLFGRFHVQCKQDCGKTLVCGHREKLKMRVVASSSEGLPVQAQPYQPESGTSTEDVQADAGHTAERCESRCGMACPPCTKPCRASCGHSRCGRLCSEACLHCKRPCQRHCAHTRCTESCGDECSFEKCNQPCERTLTECGHDCLGFCGEHCVCKCNVTAESFLDGKKENARFVLLPDCKHAFEAEGLHKRLTNDDRILRTLMCPKCNEPIQTNVRYRNVIKRISKDITVASQKFIALKIKRPLEDLSTAVQKLETQVKPKSVSRELKQFVETVRREAKKIMDNLKRALPAKTSWLNRFKSLEEDYLKVHPIREYFHIIETLYAVVNIIGEAKYDGDLNSNSYMSFVETLCRSLTIRNIFKLGIQEAEDLNNEIQRLSSISMLWQVEQSINFKSSIIPLSYAYEEARRRVCTRRPYSGKDHADTQGRIKGLADAAGVKVSPVPVRRVFTAPGLDVGRWLRCPVDAGHLYMLSDSPGSAVCPTCYSSESQESANADALPILRQRMQSLRLGVRDARGARRPRSQR